MGDKRRSFEKIYWRGRRKAAATMTALLFMGAIRFPGILPARADDWSLEGTFLFVDADKMQDEDFGWTATAADAEHRKVQDGEKDSQDGDGGNAATNSDAATAREATPSAALLSVKSVSSLGDLWDDWDGDFSFLDGDSGDGSEKKPYQIRSKSQLMGLSQLAAMGMRVQPGEGNAQIIGNYEGKHFKLTANLDLGGMEWNPIGFYQDSSEFSGQVVNSFCGHFDGNGKTISNYKMSSSLRSQVGFFGVVENGSVENLTLKPGKTVYGKDNTAILAGKAINSRIYNCTVSGNIQATGTAGGIAAQAEGDQSRGKSGMVIENCTANVTIDSGGDPGQYVGGIAGKASCASIVDCRVETGDNRTSRLQGREAIVGGIAGLQNDADIYNCYVSGAIGGAGSLIVGGITGQYASGHMKVARFEGSIGQSGMGSAGRRGTFIGHREAGNYFRYGEDVAYLFADAESKIAFNVCGSEIPDDNEYTYKAHVGYSHSGDNFYTLVQGGNSKNMEEYYYQELENGILSVLEEDNEGMDGAETRYELDHFAPNDAGRPTRGYLITVPRIDAVSSGNNYYDVAALEVRGNSSYSRSIDKDHRGAVAAGKSVTVTTSPNNTEEAKFQMEGPPTYTQGGAEKNTVYAGSGEYTFTMPNENTQVKAEYKKVAVRTSVIPAIYRISVVEERTGDRKNPVKTTRVLDNEGKLIATYINGQLEQGTQIQPVRIQAVVDANNDVADDSVRWSVDDPSLIELFRNDDEDEGGYTRKSASIRVNLEAPFFRDAIRGLEKEQADGNYRFPIPDTIYGAGHQNGGVAILTASTRPAASFEGKPCTANCRLDVTFQIKDNTYVAGEKAGLDKTELLFTVTRKLSGDRKKPAETIQVTPPQTLTASFHPDFFDKKDISWSVDDETLLTVSGEERSASVKARQDAKWIRDIIAADDGIHENDPYAVLKGAGSRSAKITVVGDDMLGNRQIAECMGTIRFVTEDQTRICVESVSLAPDQAEYELTMIKSGVNTNPAVTWEGTRPIKLTPAIFPKQAFNQEVQWKTSDDAVLIREDGTVTVNTDAQWIKKANQVPPYKAEHASTIWAVSKDGGLQAACTVKLTYRLKDETYSAGGRKSGSSGGGGGGGGRVSSGGGSGTGTGPGKESGEALGGTTPEGTAAESITGSWLPSIDGKRFFWSNGRFCRNEWAYIVNPYASQGQADADWFRFDENGNMITGWFTDEDKSVYFLSADLDGNRGKMAVGWQWIAGSDGLERCYYFNPVSDGKRGALRRNQTTPDGYQVNENGEWIENGTVKIRVPGFGV